MVFDNKKGLGNFNLFPKSVGTLTSIPFPFKLGIALFIDIVGLGFLALHGIPVVGSIASFLGSKLYAVIQAVIGALLWNNFVLVIPIAVIESIDIVNAFPTLTVLAVWNGFKTGWKR